MPTTVVKKIGATNSPTVMDYSTLAAWVAACPADLTVADQIWKGECYDQGKFTAGVTISGITTDSTRYVWLTCASGASFSTKAGVRSTALFFNSTTGSGVAVDGATGSLISANYTRLDGLQIKSTDYHTPLTVTGSNCTVQNCILTKDAGSVAGGNVATVTYANCLILMNGSSGTAVSSIAAFRNCTFVNAGSAGSAAALQSDYNAASAQNCAFFGFFKNLAGTSTLNSSSDYNASDLSSIATAGGGGSHNVTSLTFSSQFISTTTDFRATFGSGLHAGTPDSTNAPLDISLTARDATTPYIGAWEATGAAASFTTTPSDVPKGHVGHIALTLAGTGTTWAAGGSEFSLSGGVTGVSKVSENVTSTTAATLVIDTGSGTGTETITDGDSLTATFTVNTPTVSSSPSTVTVSTTPTLTLTGTHTVWTQETAAGLFSVSGVAGCSIATPTVTNDTSATAVLTVGGTTGTLVLTDNSTGATFNITVSTVSGSITITSPVQWQGYWKNGSDQADIPITGTYTGGPGTLTVEADFNGGGYTTIGTASAGSFSGTLSAQAVGQGTLTVRFANATGISDTVAHVTIGAVIAIGGQSNALGLLDNLQVYVNGAGLHAVVFAAGNSSYTSPSVWQDGNDSFVNGWSLGSPWPLLATHLMNDLGYPVIFIETPIGGRALAGQAGASSATNWYWTKFRPDTGASPGGGSPLVGYGEITSSITNAATGGVDAMLWYQGEQDIDAGIARHVYAQALGTFADQIAADFDSNPKLAIVQPGHDGSESMVPASQADAIKLALADGVLAGGNILNGLVSIYDFSNGLHIATDAEGQKVADRIFALLKSEVFGGTPGDGHGPRVVACQYNAARTAVTVCFDKVLKTGLTFSTSAWAVTGNGGAATVSAVDYHATNTRAVVLTLSGAATLPILVSLGLGSPAGLTIPLGPDFTLPAAAGTINLPAEMFKDAPAAAAEVSGGGGGGLLVGGGFGGGMQQS